MHMDVCEFLCSGLQLQRDDPPLPMPLVMEKSSILIRCSIAVGFPSVSNKSHMPCLVITQVHPLMPPTVCSV